MWLQKTVFVEIGLAGEIASETVFGHVSEKCQLYHFHVKARNTFTTDFRKQHSIWNNCITKVNKRCHGIELP